MAIGLVSQDRMYFENFSRSNLLEASEQHILGLLVREDQYSMNV